MSNVEHKVFSADARLRRRCEFDLVRRQGKNFASRHCAIQIVESPTCRRGYAFVISRRYSKKAVRRNRARRLFRECYRRFLPRLKPAWIVFRPRHAMKRAGQAQIQYELEQLLEKAGVLMSAKPNTIPTTPPTTPITKKNVRVSSDE